MGKHFGAQIIGRVLELKKEGYTNKRIGEELGYAAIQIERLVTRYNRAKRAGFPAMGPKGRPRKQGLTSAEEKDRRIQQLEMEVALMKAFIRAAERM